MYCYPSGYLQELQLWVDGVPGRERLFVSMYRMEQFVARLGYPEVKWEYIKSLPDGASRWHVHVKGSPNAERMERYQA